MKREEAKANLIALGVADPTEEQISNYLNQLEGETNGLKTQLSNAQKDAQNVADLKKQLKDLQDSKLTDEQKAENEQREKDNQIAELTAKVQAMEMKSQLAEQGITGEDADKLIESSANGLNVELLGQIIKAKEEAAAKAKEEEIAKGSTNPGGGNGGKKDDEDDKPADVQNAEAMANLFGNKTTDDKIKDYYVI